MHFVLKLEGLAVTKISSQTFDSSVSSLFYQAIPPRGRLTFCSILLLSIASLCCFVISAPRPGQAHLSTRLQFGINRPNCLITTPHDRHEVQKPGGCSSTIRKKPHHCLTEPKTAVSHSNVRPVTGECVRLLWCAVCCSC